MAVERQRNIKGHADQMRQYCRQWGTARERKQLQFPPQPSRLRIFKQKKGKDGKIKVSFYDLPEIEELINAPLEGEAFKHHREVYEGFNRLKEQKLKTKNLNAQLRPYQEEGIKWIKYLYDNNLGGCLADDMGLGKTVQTIGMLTMIYPKEKKPTLPVASAQIRMPENLVVNPSPFINHA